jgi:four helix bundle protein
MSDLPYANNFSELVVYQKSLDLAGSIFKITRKFPKDEQFSLTDQIRRSSRSVGAQIAEAWAKRRYPKHFASKLTDADGEQLETQHWLRIAYDCDYISAAARDELNALCLEIGKMLGSMIRQTEKFSGSGGSILSEDELPYLAQPDIWTPNTEH